MHWMVSRVSSEYLADPAIGIQWGAVGPGAQVRATQDGEFGFIGLWVTGQRVLESSFASFECGTGVVCNESYHLCWNTLATRDIPSQVGRAIERVKSGID
ncbi:hypothetical protein ACT17_11755 [Mycolicibacterium conceptionense]|jgi:hypothetical protein|uniref:Uncharacterized protein n=1 Tax=Mycolicibacterium conceptionense TaxID=451644 RepID=A0A0J8U9R5_9MYCO|nr:hypothetical protein ACT17_11755 [Mycolicibacterium conceptionense]